MSDSLKIVLSVTEPGHPISYVVKIPWWSQITWTANCTFLISCCSKYRRGAITNPYIPWKAPCIHLFLQIFAMQRTRPCQMPISNIPKCPLYMFTVSIHCTFCNAGNTCCLQSIFCTSTIKKCSKLMLYKLLGLMRGRNKDGIILNKAEKMIEGISRHSK